MNKVAGFFDRYRFLSNFWTCPITYEGIRYPSVEHAYQAAKTTHEPTRKQIAMLPTAGKAKRQGGMLKLREGWDDDRIDIMRVLVMDKFTRNTGLRQKLMATRDAELEETNRWGDVFWGVCEGRGENHLGKILMDVRAELRAIPEENE